MWMLGELMEQTLADSIDEELWFGLDDTDAADRAASESLAASVARITGLKPFPAVARQVVAELDSNEWSVRRVANMMGNDPSLAGMVLRVANSSFYGGGRVSADIREAVMKVGGAKLREMVMGVATLQLLGGRGRLARKFRDHCAGTAAIAKTLASVVEEDAGNLFLAGLLHDSGMLLLMDSGDFDYRAHKEQLCSASQPAEERRQLGFDHAVLGGHVLRAWGIPEPVPRLVAWHHQPVRAWSEGGQVARQLGILRLADQLCVHMDDTEGDVRPDFEMLGSTPDAGWAGLDQYKLKRVWRILTSARKEALSVFSW